jgi:hypothetical protein
MMLSCAATEPRPDNDENRSRSTRLSTGVTCSRTERITGLAEAVTATSWNWSSAASASSPSPLCRAVAKRALAVRIASSS